MKKVILGSKTIFGALYMLRRELAVDDRREFVFGELPQPGIDVVGSFPDSCRGDAEDILGRMLKDERLTLSGSRAFGLEAEESDWDFFTTDREAFEEYVSLLDNTLTRIEWLYDHYGYLNTYEADWYRDAQGREIQINLVSELLEPAEAEALSRFKKLDVASKIEAINSFYGKKYLPVFSEVEKLIDKLIRHGDFSKVKLDIKEGRIAASINGRPEYIFRATDFVCVSSSIWSRSKEELILDIYEPILNGLKDAAVTHDGVFHADEVAAMALLKIHYFTRLPVVRTRKPEVIEAYRLNGNYIIDVGGEYDGKQLFDHHQSRDGVDGMAAAGLVAKALRYSEEKNPNVMALIRAIDKQDLGVERQSPEGISNVISLLNYGDVYVPRQDLAFIEAVGVMVSVLNGARYKDRLEQDRLEAILAAEYRTVGGRTVAKFERGTVFVPAARLKGKADIVVQWDEGQSCWTAQVVPGVELELEQAKDDRIVFIHKAGFIAKVKDLRVLPLIVPPKEPGKKDVEKEV